MPDNINTSDDLNLQIAELKTRLAATNALRDPVINKVYSIVENMTIDFENEKASTIEQKISLMTKLDDLLKSKENNEINSVKMAMNKRNSDTLSNMSELAVNVLKNIAPGSVLKGNTGFRMETLTDEEMEAKISEDPSLTPISDAEMELTELPVDPNIK